MSTNDKNIAVMTVVGSDAVGIIAKISTILADNDINIKDITQTILDDIFTMIMIIDLSSSKIDMESLSKLLCEVGESRNLSIRVQLKELFNTMHRI
ncbi:MAG TPA: ACT domain-containing protein [Clostridiaceae bacterium]|jgi:ACT domain-containing protein|nr:ACT domain-containing protein [Clostridiaceae bacterium]